MSIRSDFRVFIQCSVAVVLCSRLLAQRPKETQPQNSTYTFRANVSVVSVPVVVRDKQGRARRRRNRCDATRPSAPGRSGEPDPDRDVETAHPTMVRAKMTVFGGVKTSAPPVRSLWSAWRSSAAR